MIIPKYSEISINIYIYIYIYIYIICKGTKISFTPYPLKEMVYTMNNTPIEKIFLW